MTINVKTLNGSYNIHLEKGIIKKAGELLKLSRKVLIVTDSGVPKQYSECIKAQCADPFVFTFKQGEASKSFDTYMDILSALSDNGFTRSDCVLAVGGGVAGDMAGFAAATYMRGIDFYNVPTTLLSQLDSSIGGKTAIDFKGYKNIVGAFYQPRAVLIDPDTLNTLDDRIFSCGLAEGIKMAMTFDSGLFSLIEKGNIRENITEIIYKSLLIKKSVVEKDEKEAGLRKTLNFGHTAGHAIETLSGLNTLYHGECVALGMLFFTNGEAKQRLLKVLKDNNLPYACDINADDIIRVSRLDKKKAGDKISVVRVEKIGEYILEDICFSEYERHIREVLSK